MSRKRDTIGGLIGGSALAAAYGLPLALRQEATVSKTLRRWIRRAQRGIRWSIAGDKIQWWGPRGKAERIRRRLVRDIEIGRRAILPLLIPPLIGGALGGGALSIAGGLGASLIAQEIARQKLRLPSKVKTVKAWTKKMPTSMRKYKKILIAHMAPIAAGLAAMGIIHQLTGK